MTTENEAFVFGLIDSFSNHKEEWALDVRGFSTLVRTTEKHHFIHTKTGLSLLYAIVDSGDLLVLKPNIQITDFENKKIKIALAATLLVDARKKKEQEEREKYLKEVGSILDYFSKNDNIATKL
jgi:hypothetical protein